MTTTIYGTDIEHNGDVDYGLQWLENHWNDKYVLDVFENAKTSRDYSASFKIDGEKGVYVLKYISKDYYSLHWEA